MNEKTILSSAFKIINEASDWVDERNDILYRDFYNYTLGITNLADKLIRKLDSKSEGLENENCF